MPSPLRCSAISLMSTTVLGVLVLTGCNDEPQSSQAQPGVYALDPDEEQGAMGGAGIAPGGGTAESDELLRFAGLSAAAPEGWTSERTSSSMRAVQMRVPGASDAGDAGFVIFTGISGSVDQNITRWEGQFSGPEGEPVTAKRTTQDIGSLNVATAELTGTFSGGMLNESPGPGVTMIQSIVELPDGSMVFVRLLGPSATVDANRAAFEELLQSIK